MFMVGYASLVATQESNWHCQPYANSCSSHYEAACPSPTAACMPLLDMPAINLSYCALCSWSGAGTGTGSTGALTGGTDKISSSISSSGSTDRVAGERGVEGQL
jgi:hypothetical protein